MKISDDELKHVGVLGMKWGKRRSQEEVETERGEKRFQKEKKTLFKAIEKRRIREKEDVRSMSDDQIKSVLSSKAMQQKLKNYTEKAKLEKIQKAIAITQASIFLLTVFSPLIIKTGGAVYTFARDKNFDHMLNKYGGFDPATVINSKFK